MNRGNREPEGASPLGGSKPIAVQLTVLGSGSSGNATLVVHGAARVLIDAGLSYRALKGRLDALCVDPDSVRAIFVTHAHIDHIRSAASFSRRHGTPIYATATTRAAWGERALQISTWKPLKPGQMTECGTLRFLPFTVPHDALETLAFRIDTAEGAIGLATDIGCVTAEMVSKFRSCCLLVLESNHAADLLCVSPYAPSVRTRIGSDDGHLSNEALATFLAEHLGDGVRCVVLAHLSRVNNVPELAEMTCREALMQRGHPDVRVVVAGQRSATPTIDLAGLAAEMAAAVRVPAGMRQVDLPFA